MKNINLIGSGLHTLVSTAAGYLLITELDDYLAVGIGIYLILIAGMYLGHQVKKEEI